MTGRHRRRPAARWWVIGAGLTIFAVAVGGWLLGDPAPVAPPRPPSAAQSALPSTSAAKAVVAPASRKRVDDGRSARLARDLTRPSLATPVTTPVLLFGDSLALGLSSLLPPLIPTRPVSVNAEVGRGSTSAVYVLGTLPTPLPPTWVVSLGTNDYDDAAFAADVDAIMSAAGPSRCVVWFDIWRPGSDTTVNAVLVAAAAAHPNLHLVGWHDLAAAHPYWFSGTDVHPSSEGYAARAEQAAQAVDADCR
ncbi:MAG: hypothetical protein WAN48_12275 [Actinomycetes bacterium]